MGETRKLCLQSLNGSSSGHQTANKSKKRPNQYPLGGSWSDLGRTMLWALISVLQPHTLLSVFHLCFFFFFEQKVIFLPIFLRTKQCCRVLFGLSEPSLPTETSGKKTNTKKFIVFPLEMPRRVIIVIIIIIGEREAPQPICGSMKGEINEIWSRKIKWTISRHGVVMDLHKRHSRKGAGRRVKEKGAFSFPN